MAKKKTSIHGKPCNIRCAEAHNSRKKELDYIRTDLSHLNESYNFTEESLVSIKRKCAKLVKEKTGRKMQKKAVPIVEFVLITEGPNTSMAEIVEVANRLSSRFHYVPIRIWHHLDEGHMHSKNVRDYRKGLTKDWVPNYHAHIIMQAVDPETGLSVRPSSSDLSEMQDIAAEVLGMERGKKTGRRGLTALEYKLQETEKRVVELQKDLTQLHDEREHLVGEVAELNGTIDRLQSENEILRQEAVRLREAASEINSVREAASKDIASASTGGIFTSQKTKEERRRRQSELADKLAQTQKLGEQSSEIVELKEQLKKKSAEIQTLKTSLSAEREMNEDLKDLHPEESSVLGQMAEIGLKTAERRGLLKGMELTAKRAWRDPSSGEYTDELDAKVSLSDGKVLMDGKSVADFFKNFWAAVATATTKAIRAFNKDYGLAEDTPISASYYTRKNGDLNLRLSIGEGRSVVSGAVDDADRKRIRAIWGHAPLLTAMRQKLDMIRRYIPKSDVHGAMSQHLSGKLDFKR